MSKQLYIQLDPINYKCFSRSEAREILADAKGFDALVFDFDGIPRVEWEFIDEIYGKFRREYPRVSISEMNMNPQVTSIIYTCKSTRQ